MRWYSYLTGYLLVLIEGEVPVKVINMALARGIFLWDIMELEKGKILLKVRVYAFRPLARIVRKCACRIKIMEKRGLPFQIVRLKKRKTLALGGIFFLLSLYILSSFVWFIDVQGNEDLTDGEIKKIAADLGLKPGVVINKLDFDKLEKEMQEAHPKLAWVGINIQGTKVTIEVSEKVLIPDIEENLKGHLVARESGIIEEMLVLKGTPQVKEKDKVIKGQILISGIVYPELILNEDGTYTPGGIPELVRAKGIVRARVLHSVRASCFLKERETYFTGEKIEQVLLKCGERIFVLKGPKNVPFQYYDKKTAVKTFPAWRNLHVPVELITNIYLEQIKKVKEYTFESAYQEAVKRAENALAKTLPKDARVLNKIPQVNSGQGNELVEVEVTWECLENIAVFQPISGE